MTDVNLESFSRWLLDTKESLRKAGQPLVTLTYAQSLDGSITAHRGQPLALSGEETSRVTHHLRAAHDAILVGSGTVLADDPRLTVRFAQGRHPQPIVLDGRLRTPPQARLFEGGRQPWIATTADAPPERWAALESAGACLIPLPQTTAGTLDLAALLDVLNRRGISSLMVEGGASVITSFLAAQLADRIVLTLAPRFVGGLNAITRTLGQDDFPRLIDYEAARLGEDLLVWGRPGWPRSRVNERKSR